MAIDITRHHTNAIPTQTFSGPAGALNQSRGGL
jgi:hypothetical protein